MENLIIKTLLFLPFTIIVLLFYLKRERERENRIKKEFENINNPKKINKFIKRKKNSIKEVKKIFTNYFIGLFIIFTLTIGPAIQGILSGAERDTITVLIFTGNMFFIILIGIFNLVFFIYLAIDRMSKKN